MKLNRARWNRNGDLLLRLWVSKEDDSTIWIINRVSATYLGADAHGVERRDDIRRPSIHPFYRVRCRCD